MKKLLIIAIILVLIGFILLFLLNQSKSPITNNQLPVTNEQVANNQLPIVNQSQELTPEQKTELEKKELMVQARNFIERFGSFSTDAQFTNLYELKNEMTDRFRQETEKYIAAQQLKTNNEFYSISTKVLNIIEKNFSDNSTIYSVSVQRKETKKQIEKILYQNAEIKMVKQAETWLVDSIKWQ